MSYYQNTGLTNDFDSLIRSKCEHIYGHSGTSYETWFIYDIQKEKLEDIAELFKYCPRCGVKL